MLRADPLLNPYEALAVQSNSAGMRKTSREMSFMGLFSGLEGSLEKYIEGFFKDTFGGGCVQPVEIAKRLAREMRDCRRVSINRIYVPNHYVVYLNPSDWEKIANFGNLLSSELQDYISQKAKEKKYTLTGQPSVSFNTDENLSAGMIRLESAFKTTAAPEEPAGQEGDIERTQRFIPVKDSVRADHQPRVYGVLEVDEGPEQGRIFPLKGVNILIGRREDCQIVFNDTSVSRRHARLELHRGRYTIQDLGSTNGTLVNGVRITSKVLEPGDVLTFGTTICTFKVD
ncbi:MAG TPA: DUF3662 and FHA domain-containing protein [Bacillota bacterium]|nr:DUF3662 and FHA domain-containing protein [Bacillota bacterium]